MNTRLVAAPSLPIPTMYVLESRTKIMNMAYAIELCSGLHHFDRIIPP